MASRSRRHEVLEEESYFISMADMMVGLLFVFVILLLYFALQFQTDHRKLTNANLARDELLQLLVKNLQAKKIAVKINKSRDGLLLPQEVLFPTGVAELTEDGKTKIDTVAAELAGILPCYTYPRRPATGPRCPKDTHDIDAIFVEGHTDTTPLNPGAKFRDNLDLSVTRATNTYRRLLDAAPVLKTMRNGADASAPSLFSASGYGEHRPVDPTTKDTDAGKKENRRIELRFLMSTKWGEGD